VVAVESFPRLAGQPAGDAAGRADPRSRMPLVLAAGILAVSVVA
jgi:hypothetical protein